MSIIKETIYLLDQTTESTDHDCHICHNAFALIARTDAFGFKTFTGGEVIRDQMVCSECIPEAVERWSQDLQAERALGDEDAQHLAELADLAELGYLDSEPTEQPDVWPLVGPDPISEADRIGWY